MAHLLLLDWKFILPNTNPCLSKKLEKYTKSKDERDNLLVLKISSEGYWKFMKSDDKWVYFNDINFCKYIEDGDCVYYHKDRCLLNENQTNKFISNLEEFQTCLKEQFNPMPFLTICIDIRNDNFMKNLQRCLNHNFCHPRLRNDRLYLTWDDKSNCISSENIHNYIDHLLVQKNINRCNLIGRFDKNTQEYLKCIIEKHDNEVSGIFHISNIEKKSGSYIYTFSIQGKFAGKDQDVNVPYSRYNFHSHPKKAYENNNVKYGWPSSTDFLGVYNLGQRTMFHCVSSVEGVYIIFMNNYWFETEDRIPDDFILYSFNIDKNTDDINNFIKNVNSITYNGHGIFNVSFLPWSKIQNNFHITYGKLGQSCLMSDLAYLQYKSDDEN